MSNGASADSSYHVHLHQKSLLLVSQWLMFNANWEIFPAISWRQKNKFWWDDDVVRFTQTDFFYSARSLKLQSVGNHYVPNIFLTPSQPVFTHTPYCCVPRSSRSKYQLYSLWYGYDQRVLENTIYRIRGEHAIHYITDASYVVVYIHATIIKWQCLLLKQVWTAIFALISNFSRGVISLLWK